MEIDLLEVIKCLDGKRQSRALMRSIMQDLYPGKNREMNTLLDVYESGIPQRIKEAGAIRTEQYEQYIHIIMDEYGLQQKYAENALDCWIDICIKPGTASSICKSKNVIEGDTYTKPVIHTDFQTTVVNIRSNAHGYKVTELGNGKIEIKKFLGFAQADTVIPTEIDGKRVVGIGENAFKQCRKIERLIVPEGIEYISAGAFAECRKLNRIILPESLKELGKMTTYTISGKGAFEGTAISEIDIPNGVTIIGKLCFKGCKNLRKIVFPDNLQKIEQLAFCGCCSLEKVTLPATCESVGSYAFDLCSMLSKVVLNEGLKQIEIKAFGDTPKLFYLAIPKSVELIEEGAFGTKEENKTIGCYPGSKALQYARENNLKIKNISR